MKTRQELIDLSLRLHWSVEAGHLNEAVRILDDLQMTKAESPAPGFVTCPPCGHYVPGHATGAGDICDCNPSLQERRAQIEGVLKGACIF